MRRSCVAILSSVQGLLLFAPLVVLGRAIDWPASLRAPPAELFPRLLAHAAEVRLGYGLYLLFSVLFGVTGVALARFVSRGAPEVFVIAAAAAVVSALARAIGILRWLTAMPALAEAHQNATEAPTRAALEAIAVALNRWGGAIGEALGVSLFASVWLIVVSVEALRTKELPRVLAVAGLVTAALALLPLLGLFGFDAGRAVTAASAAVQVWFLVTGGVLAFGGRHLATKAHAS